MDQTPRLRKATAARKRFAAERHEATADRFRREAAQLEARAAAQPDAIEVRRRDPQDESDRT